MRNEVIRAAWQDAEQKAATKRPPRRKKVTKLGAKEVSREKSMGDANSEWQRKGATLCDTTARTEFGLTRGEIVRAIEAGHTGAEGLVVRILPDGRPVGESRSSAGASVEARQPRPQPASGLD